MNQIQKQMKQDELTRERMAFMTQQGTEQARIEKERQRTALLSLSVDLLKQSDEAVITPEKAVEWAGKLEAFVKG